MAPKVYFPALQQAPYLQSHRPHSETTQDVRDRSISEEHNTDGLQEADAAAGLPPRSRGLSGTNRVGSFQQLFSAYDNPLSPTRRTPSRLLAASGSIDTTTADQGDVSRQQQQQVRDPTQQSRRQEAHPSLRHSTAPNTEITPDWRLRERMKTVGVGLVLALNVGTDPPDIVKPHPCAVLQCWMNPLTVSRAKAKEQIGERLEQQYANARSTSAARPIKFRKALDPTVEDVRILCLHLRRQARNDRVLLHYNGLGVPRPTNIAGEIWCFDSNHTQYVPLAVTDLRLWLGKPAIVVLDCSSAGVLVPFFSNPLNNISTNANAAQQQAQGDDDDGNDDESEEGLSLEERTMNFVKDTIVLAACGPDELLPMDPNYPADIFTSCLTTPIRMALRWFVRRNPSSMSGLDPEALDAIPGNATDRKTPLGELNWIFTAVTDSIAWNVLPRYLFQLLFRQDLLVASMFRNFLLADRILRQLGCTPVSYPPLPPTAENHPLWQNWDLACETLLFQLIKDGVLPTKATPENRQHTDDQQDRDVAKEQPPSVLTATSPAASQFVSSPFFSEQLTAFEVWLDFTSIHKIRLASGALKHSSPEQLPVVLQVLLFQVHRVRALELLRRFLDLGPWAVNLSLSLGIFPYVMKLLQSPQYKNLLVSIWASILAFDPSCRVDLLKDGAFHHFVQHLMWGLNSNVVDVEEAARERTLAAFVLSSACHSYPAGQVECVRLNLHGSCCALLSSYEQGEHAQDDKTLELHLPSHFRLWLVLCLASMVVDNTPIQNEAYGVGVHQRLAVRLQNDQNVNVRAAACYALGCLVGSKPRKGSRQSSQQDLLGAFQASSQPQQPSFPRGLVAPTPIPNMVLPDAIAASQLRPAQLPQGQLQPSFTATAGIPNLALGPQYVQPLQGGAMQAGAGAPTTMAQGPAAFWNQPVSLRTAPQTTPLQPSYILPTGQPLTPGLGGPGGFLVGSAPVIGQGSLLDSTAAFHLPVSEPQTPSVFQDRRRLALDLSCMDMLVKGTDDASVMVRYEAVMGLACAFGKYLEAFVAVAGEASAADRTAALDRPAGLDNKTMEKFKTVWLKVRSLQKEDVFPAVSQAANDIVLVVNESLLRLRSDGDHEGGRVLEGPNVLSPTVASALAGIDEDAETTADLPSARTNLYGESSRKGDLRRVASEFATSQTGGSMERHAQLSAASSQQTSSEDTKDADLLTYKLPKSEYFDWKRKAFDHTFKTTEVDAFDIDPLSPEGAAKLYRERRDFVVKEKARQLSQHYASLAPRPPKAVKKGIELILEEEDEEAALAALEEETSAKKRELKLKEARLLRNHGVKMTSMLLFHPYEDYLVSCDGSDKVSSWDTNTGICATSFKNGNPEGSRMTSTCWINESSQSLFLVGSDDGAVRLWGGLAEPRGEACSPALISSFNALPMNEGQRRSGLVCEWQPWSGLLACAGSSKYLRCWDLESEKLSLQIETNTDAHITTLTTAWEHDQIESGSLPYSTAGVGPNIVVAGLSDGALRIFDVRTSRTGHDLRTNSSRPPRRQGPRATQYSEHKSWVVATAFTSYSHKNEIISGTLSGEIKAWDLRMSTSVRTFGAQRSTMTTLAVHPKIPIMATGSHAQFIKVLTHDGDTLQVLRYHEKMANHRIGPVSCVAFHPFKPVLAAGATDNFIGLYAPKKTIF